MTAGPIPRRMGDVLGANDLVLCSGSLMQAGFCDMVEAAAATGFQAITLWPDDYRGALAQGLTAADMRSMLREHGLEVADLDALLTWLPLEVTGGVDPAPQADVTEKDFFEMAEALSARSLNVAQGFGDQLDLDGAAEALAGLCDRAWEHGLLITLEFLPWSGIPDLATARELVERAGRPNGTVMIDTWHFFRGGSDLAQLAAMPGARVGSVQINDAPSEASPNVIEETMTARLLPGEGEAPVEAVVRTLDRIDAKAPIGVEVFSKELQALPAREAAQRCATAARQLLATARR
ncbi:MAG: xylose isomerase [Deltaproteobacteria bacterium]|nr:xylose isomerase [Deltaproteobacteria bacterium]